MDLTVGLRLRASTDGTSAIRAMREETAELASAMKEVREAAKSGGMVTPKTIKTLGGFDQFQKAFTDAQKELTAGAKATAGPVDPEKLFRGRLRMTNEQARVRAREAARGAAAELKADAAVQKEAAETFAFRRRMTEQQRRDAEETATVEVRAAERAARAQQRADAEAQRSAAEVFAFRKRMTEQRLQEENKAAAQDRREHRERMRGMGLGMFVSGGGEDEEHGGGHGGHGRGLMSELKTAAGYTLVYGGINKLLQGVGAVASSPLTVGKMTLGVAQQSREIMEASKALGVSAREYQTVRFALAAKGMKADQIDPMLRFMERNAVAAIRNTKTQAVAFKALGISTAELRRGTNNPAALLDRVGEALDRVHNKAAKVALAQMIFGRGGAQYLPLFAGGGLHGAAAEADASGAMLSDAQLARGEALAAQWEKLKMQGAGVRNQLAEAAMPIVSDVVSGASTFLTDHQAEISKAIKDDFATIRDDMPGIINGMSSMASLGFKIAGAIRPMIDTFNAIGEDMDKLHNQQLWWQQGWNKASVAWDGLAGRSSVNDQLDARTVRGGRYLGDPIPLGPSLVNSPDPAVQEFKGEIQFHLTPEASKLLQVSRTKSSNTAVSMQVNRGLVLANQ